ncbi:MAG: NADH-quinone oxidoreductase subunit NuoK [Phycisphaerae bacterium]
MGSIELYHYLVVGAVLFVLGLIGFMVRRNLILMFLCTELMFQGVALNFVAFSRYHFNPQGQSFVIFLLAVAAAEASLALGLVVYLYKNKATLDTEAWSQLQG